MLNEQQRKQAADLLAARPAVLPGTSVIPESRARTLWYHAVGEAIVTLEPDDIIEFCDLAGVPD